MGTALIVSTLIPGESKKDAGLEEKVGRGNIVLRAFPDELYGAKRVDKYEVPGSEYCLVHFRQLHSRPEFEYDSPVMKKLNNPENPHRDFFINAVREHYFDVNNVQMRIFGELVQMQKYRTHDGLMSEGSTRELSAEELKEMYLLELGKIKETGLFDGEFERGEIQKMGLYPGAYLYVGQEGRYRLLHTESEELLERAENGDEEAKYDLREDFVLKRASEYGRDLMPLTYGAGHSFRDNIDRWNAQYPNKRFSLIEVTPIGVGDKKEKSYTKN